MCSDECRGKHYGKSPEAIRKQLQRVSKNVTKWRRETKLKAVEYKGGQCHICGYNQCIEALEFHHRDPNEKDFHLAQSGNCRSWGAIKLELDKCVLLCANCHREIHAGFTSCP